MTKKWMAGALCAALVFSLAACGSKGNTETGTDSGKDYVYVPSYMEWNVAQTENDSFYISDMSGGKAFAQWYSSSEEEGNTNKTICMDLKTGEVTDVNYTMEGDWYLSSYSLTSDGQLVGLAQLSDYDEATGNWKYSFAVVTFDAEGNEVSRVDLTPLYNELAAENEWAYFSGMCVGGDGTIYTYCDDQLFAVGTDGSRLFTVTCSGWIQNLGVSADGRVYISYYEDGYKMAFIDKDAKGLGETVDLGNTGISGYFNVTADNVMFYSDNTGMRRMDLNTGESEQLFTWISQDMLSSYIQGVYGEDDEHIYAYYYDWDSNDQSVVQFTKADKSTVTEKTILTLAMLSSDSNVQAQIIKFNKSNDAYRIEPIVYIDYSNMSDEDWNNFEQYRSDAAARMLNDITGSNPPDLIELESYGGVTLDTLVEKGVAEEITPYLESAGYAEEDFLESIVDAYKVDGKLYSIPARFYLMTGLADSAIVGNKQGWTLEELLDVVNNLPEGMSFTEYVTRDSFIVECMSFGYDNFVDTANGTCNFDSDAFKQLLQIAKMMPEEYNYDNEDYVSTPEKLIAGDILYYETSISSLDDVQMCLAMFGDKTPTFIGLPGAKGNGTLIGSYGNTMVINSKSQYKDACAEFIISSFKADTNSNRYTWGFPTLKSELDALMEKEITVTYMTDENGDPILDENGDPIPEGGVSSVGWGNWTYQYRQNTQEDVDIFMDLLNGAGGTYSYNDELLSIITEEAAPYFSGQKSVDDVASIIQNRISLYLSEQS